MYQIRGFVRGYVETYVSGLLKATAFDYWLSLLLDMATFDDDHVSSVFCEIYDKMLLEIRKQFSNIEYRFSIFKNIWIKLLEYYSFWELCCRHLFLLN